MKTSAKAIALVAILSVANLASAQQFGIHLGISPQGVKPSLTYNGYGSGSLMNQVRKPHTYNPYQQIGPHGTWNPAVETSNPTLRGLSYDPMTGRLTAHTESHEVRASALDPNRHIVDPGSRRARSSVSKDSYGNVYVVEVISWTSYGVPHSKTTRKLLQRGTGNLGGLPTDTSHTHTTVAVPLAPSN